MCGPTGRRTHWRASSHWPRRSGSTTTGRGARRSWSPRGRGVTESRRARAADRGARIAEHDEALRPDGAHSDGPRDRAHRDLSVEDIPAAPARVQDLPTRPGTGADLTGCRRIRGPVRALSSPWAGSPATESAHRVRRMAAQARAAVMSESQLRAKVRRARSRSISSTAWRGTSTGSRNASAPARSTTRSTPARRLMLIHHSSLDALNSL